MLLFELKTWVLVAAIIQKLKGIHVSFMWQVTGMTDRNLGDKTWQKEGADRVIQEAGTKAEMGCGDSGKVQGSYLQSNGRISMR